MIQSSFKRAGQNMTFVISQNFFPLMKKSLKNSGYKYLGSRPIKKIQCSFLNYNESKKFKSNDEIKNKSLKRTVWSYDCAKEI